jgi:integrase
MASIGNDPGGRRRILFVGLDGKRHTIRLGKMPKRAAEEVKRRVEALVAAHMSRSPIDADNARWIAELPDNMAERFAAVGLITARQQRVTMPLKKFLDAFVARKHRAKPATKEIWGQVVRNLVDHFGGDRDVTTITEEDAEGFKDYLVDQRLARTTISKRLQFTRGFFKFAVKKKLLAENPFAEVSEVAVGLPNTKRFISREETAALMAASDLTWQTIIALGRYGGLRCPSEVASLRWEDIDWDSGRMTVTSPKTEHHEGKETRVLPIFPELATVLTAAFEAAEDGAVYVIGGHLREKALRPSGWRSCNLRTQFGRIIKRAGLKAWPRLFHNLRASRETELLREHPIHVVTAWLGNSPRIALKHYCMVTDHDFDRARGVAEKAPSVHVEPSVDATAPGLQPAQATASLAVGNADRTTGAAGADRATDGDTQPSDTTPAAVPTTSAEKGGTESGTVVAQNAAQRLHAAVREDSHDHRANPSSPVTSAMSRDSSRNPAKPKNGEGGIRTRGPAFDRTRL